MLRLLHQTRHTLLIQRGITIDYVDIIWIVNVDIIWIFLDILLDITSARADIMDITRHCVDIIWI